MYFFLRRNTPFDIRFFAGDNLLPVSGARACLILFKKLFVVEMSVYFTMQIVLVSVSDVLILTS